MSDMAKTNDDATVKLAHEDLALIPGRAVFWANLKHVIAFGVWFALLLLAFGVMFKILPFSLDNGAIALLMVSGTVALYLWNRMSKNSRSVRRLRYDGEIHLFRFGPVMKPLLAEEFAEHMELQKMIKSTGAEPIESDPKNSSRESQKHFWRVRNNLAKLLRRYAPEVLELMREEARTLMNNDDDMAVYRVGVDGSGKYFVKRMHICSIPCAELKLHNKSYAEAKQNWKW